MDYVDIQVKGNALSYGRWNHDGDWLHLMRVPAHIAENVAYNLNSVFGVDVQGVSMVQGTIHTTEYFINGKVVFNG